VVAKAGGRRVVLQGVPASPGIAMGPAYVLRPDEQEVQKRLIAPEKIEAEIIRLKRALEKAEKEILGLRSRITPDVGEYEARIFDSHILILKDEELIETVINDIRRESWCAEYAYFHRVEQINEQFRSLSGGLIKDHMTDLHDVATRVIDTLMLSQSSNSYIDTGDPVIVLTRHLTPSMLVQFNRKNTLGLTTEVGGKTSHVAILARALAIPAVSSIHWGGTEIDSGSPVIVDGSAGIVILNPSLKDIKEYEMRKAAWFAMERELSALVNVDPVTRDGKYVEIMANIELPIEVEAVLESGADAVGLYRSEFLYLTRDELPAEDEQYHAYRYMGERMGQKTVTIRTMDAGGDKIVPALKMSGEANPFMGWRSIRVCLDNPSIFKTQLRAILRAGLGTSIRLMFPMISNLGEIREAKRLLEVARSELREEGIPFQEKMEVGCMVEVPSAVILALELAREVDFFSIGTNDLTQFTLAVDRANERIAALFEPHSPAILRQIKSVIDTARHQGIHVSICGEMAADPLVALLFVGMGVDGLSMGPASILEMKKMIRSITFVEAREASEKVQSLSTADEITAYLHERFGVRFREMGILEPDR
jgi:phosphoenolpyruvate-protein phosphotransferase (PTS system enzyme I)